MKKRGTGQQSNRRKTPKGRPFPPGVSGNPGGRPKGIVTRVREVTQDGDALVQFFWAILTGDTAILQQQFQWAGIPSLEDKRDAAKWLADRGFGKPMQPLEAGGESRVRIILEEQKEV